MLEDDDLPRTVQLPPASADDGGGRPIVAIFGLAPHLSTEGPHARTVTARAFDRSRATGEPVEIDLDEGTGAGRTPLPVAITSRWRRERPAVAPDVRVDTSRWRRHHSNDRQATTMSALIQPEAIKLS